MLNALTQYIREQQVLYPSINQTHTDVLTKLLFGTSETVVNGQLQVTVDFCREVDFKAYYRTQRTLDEMITHCNDYQSEEAIQDTFCRLVDLGGILEEDKPHAYYRDLAWQEWNDRYNNVIHIDNSKTPPFVVGTMVNELKLSKYKPYVDYYEGGSVASKFTKNTDPVLIQVTLYLIRAWMIHIGAWLRDPTKGEDPILGGKVDYVQHCEDVKTILVKEMKRLESLHENLK